MWHTRIQCYTTTLALLLVLIHDNAYIHKNECIRGGGRGRGMGDKGKDKSLCSETRASDHPPCSSATGTVANSRDYT